MDPAVVAGRWSRRFKSRDTVSQQGDSGRRVFSPRNRESNVCVWVQLFAVRDIFRLRARTLSTLSLATADRRSVRGDRRARPGRLRVGGSRSSRLIVTSILLSVAERCPYATRRGRAVRTRRYHAPQIVLLTARVTDTCALSGDRTCPRIARRSMPHGGTRTTLGWSLAWSVLVCLFARCRWYLRPSYLRPV